MVVLIVGFLLYFCGTENMGSYHAFLLFSKAQKERKIAIALTLST